MQLIMNVFPEYNWLPWKFSVVPLGYWNNKDNQLKYMNWLAIQLNINIIEDWYNVTNKVYIYYY